jgi:Methyltransferase domain
MPNNNASYSSIHKARTGKTSDKWDLYLNVYDRLPWLKGHGSEILNILEIGIQNGGSLETWADLVPDAEKIIGCDINPKCQRLIFSDPRIKIIIGDANSAATEASIKAASATYDLVIDDGSHASSDIIGNFIRYFSLLSPGGIYIAEDLHCCYWQEYGGGLGAPRSGIEFFKLLIDCINSNNWGRNDIKASDYASKPASEQGLFVSENLLASIASIQFFDSLCIVQKMGPGQPARISKRIVSGESSEVETAVLPCHGNSIASPDQSSHEWNSPLSSEEQILFLKKEVEHMSNSRSWRLTKPLRKAAAITRSLMHQARRLARG